MSATLEQRVLSRVIHDSDLAPLRTLQVDSTWFTDNADQRLWQYLVEHYGRHGEVPSRQMVKLNFPTYTVWKVQDSLEPLVEKLRDKRAYGSLVAGLQDAGEALEEDRDWRAAAQSMRVALLEVERETAELVDMNLATTIEERMKGYDYLAEHPNELLGLPTGFPTIDKATLGMQPEQLICIIATPKVGKSTLSLRIARNVQMLTKGEAKGLFVSFEMSAREQAARYDAMVGGISHTHLLTGRLPLDDRKKLRTRMAATSDHHLVLSTDTSSATTLGGIAAKIDAYEPAYVVIDGVYLMQDETGEKPGSPQALTNITRGMKRLAQRYKIPILISTQVLPSKMSKRDGVTADAIGYSSSFFQDSDVILGLDKGENDDQRTLKVVESRNCGKVEVGLLWDWTTSRFEEVDGYAGPDPDDEDAEDESDDWRVA